MFSHPGIPLLLLFLLVNPLYACGLEGAIKVGWIGSLTGPIAKYGAGQAALIAVDDINADGGIRGKKLELLMEDGQGKGSVSLAAFQKLVTLDKVRFIVGGNCTPESAPIAPLAHENGVVLLAAITSTPKLTGVNRNFFRISQPNSVTGKLVADYARLHKKANTAAIIVEETDYAMPVAQAFKEEFELQGGRLLQESSFQPGEVDFRAIAVKVKGNSPDVIYIAGQSIDSAKILIKQIRDSRVFAPILGNEMVGNIASSNPDMVEMLRGIVFAEPAFDINAPLTRSFADKFKARYHLPELPHGFWTSEAYDSVRLMADVINRCGEDVSEVIKCLEQVRDYKGVSGVISIGPDHDGQRETVLKIVGKDGKATPGGQLLNEAA